MNLKLDLDEYEGVINRYWNYHDKIMDKETCYFIFFFDEMIPKDWKYYDLYPANQFEYPTPSYQADS